MNCNYKCKCKCPPPDKCSSNEKECRQAKQYILNHKKCKHKHYQKNNISTYGVFIIIIIILLMALFFFTLI